MTHLPEKTRLFLAKYNIEKPTRYPVEILQTMMQLESGEFPKDKSLALIITPKADWNNAFTHQDPLKELSSTYVPIVFEVGQDSDMIRACEAIKKFGKPIDYLQIG
jgi:hypothetical protein